LKESEEFVQLKQKLDAGEKVMIVDLHGRRGRARGQAQCASIRIGLDGATVPTTERQSLAIAKSSFTVLLHVSSRARV
jgi:hypothetical protein